MYAAHFGLREPPFNNTPDPRFFHNTGDHEEALACLVYAVQEFKGSVLLTGEIGAGKTLLTRMMLRHFGERISSTVINNARLDADELLVAVCRGFGLDTAAHASCFDRLNALQDYLLAQFAARRPAVLVLDEAQDLSDDALQQVRTIGNLEADNARLLQIVIVGQPELGQRFADPHLRQLNQRIFRRCHLPALSREACADYIRHRLTVAGHNSEANGQETCWIFDDGALDEIHASSAGLPRLINNVCDNAMLCAYAADRGTIDRPFTSEVIAQLSPHQIGQSKAHRRRPARLRSTSSRPVSVHSAGLRTARFSPAPRRNPPADTSSESPQATCPEASDRAGQIHGSLAHTRSALNTLRMLTAHTQRRLPPLPSGQLAQESNEPAVLAGKADR